MVAEEEARFHEGLRRVDSFWFSCRYRNQAMNGKMVVVENEADLILEG